MFRVVTSSTRRSWKCVVLAVLPVLVSSRYGVLPATPPQKAHPRVFDIEDMVTLGRQLNACPYFACRELHEKSQLVLCPYNYVVCPPPRYCLAPLLPQYCLCVCPPLPLALPAGPHHPGQRQRAAGEQRHHF